MAGAPLYKSTGSIYALNLTNAVKGPVTVTQSAPDNLLALAFVNSGVTPCAIVIQQVQNLGAPSLTAPVDGTPTTIDAVLLPGSMTMPMIIPVPQGGCNVFGRSVSTGTSIVYFTPTEIHS